MAAPVQNLKFELLWAFLPLVGALLLGAVILSWAKQWRKRSTPTPGTANEQLAHFRTLYERGELTPAEFERVRARLSEQLRQEMQAKAIEQPLEVTSLANLPSTEDSSDLQTPPGTPGEPPSENRPGPDNPDPTTSG